MKQFKALQTSLTELDAPEIAALITATADLALLLDGNGVIREVFLGKDDLPLAAQGEWLGCPWIDTVTVESRPKIESLLRASSLDSPAQWRQVNHPALTGPDVPISYSAVRYGGPGNVLATGRELRSVAMMQQRLVEAQQSLERDYSRLRQLETRYSLLFKLSSEAVFIVDAASRRVVEANPAAVGLFGETAQQIVGRAFPFGFDDAGMPGVDSLLADVRAAGSGDAVLATLGGDGRQVMVSASLFRQERAVMFLIRLTPQQANDAGGLLPKARTLMFDVLESMPDGFVITDLAGRILTANTAFLELAQLATEKQARGEPLGRFVGRAGVDINTLIGNLKATDFVRLLNTTLQGDHGSTSDVEISAVGVPHGDPPCLGFVIRDVSQRLSMTPLSGTDLPHSVDQLTELVGRVPLKDIISDTNDMIERLCIQAALELTGDNRASAAEMLGLSRQSLYVKLRRYGLGDLDSDNRS